MRAFENYPSNTNYRLCGKLPWSKRASSIALWLLHQNRWGVVLGTKKIFFLFHILAKSSFSELSHLGNNNFTLMCPADRPTGDLSVPFINIYHSITHSTHHCFSLSLCFVLKNHFSTQPWKWWTLKNVPSLWPYHSLVVFFHLVRFFSLSLP